MRQQITDYVIQHINVDPLKYFRNNRLETETNGWVTECVYWLVRHSRDYAVEHEDAKDVSFINFIGHNNPWTQKDRRIFDILFRLNGRKKKVWHATDWRCSTAHSDTLTRNILIGGNHDDKRVINVGSASARQQTRLLNI